MSGVWFPLIALTINLFMIIIFFVKENIKNKEVKVYRNMLITGVLFSLNATLVYILAMKTNFDLAVNWMQKIHLLLLIISAHFFLQYEIIINNLKSETEITLKNIATIILTFASIIVIILPVTTICYDQVLAIDGLSYFSAMSYLLICFISILILSVMFITKNKKDIKKNIPLIILILLFICGLLLNHFYPEIIIETYIVAFVELIMYFTIENPDVKMLEQLSIAKEQAEKSNRAKSDFLSSMSHEIRTPLNAIVGLSEDLLNRENCPDNMKEDLEDVVSASHTLLEIVGNIMDISKIESNKMEIINIPYNFKEEVETLCRVNSVRIGDKQLELKLNIAEDIPYELIGDKGHIKEIINNLLSNAIKYTDQGLVELNAQCINQNNKCILMIIIKDTGRGIKSENIEKLFTKFERLDIEKNTTIEGTGLGLAITKKLVDLMGGSINVQSQYGKGSIFIVKIPQTISKLSKPIDLRKNNDTAAVVLNNKLSPNYCNKKILIVDDNKLNIKVARRSLEQLNFERIDECYNGEECLELIQKNNIYDLILMDIMMPIMSGETAIKELKNINSFNTPVIALTADAIAGADVKYKEEGFVDYISKPFTKEQIKEKIDVIFTQKNINNSNPIYNPNQDRWKNVQPYIVGENIKNEEN